MKWTSWLGAAVLLGLVSFVVWSSFRIGGVRCETCIEFEGRRACRAVEGTSEEETLTAARTNTCALLANGVTQTMACQRTPPASSNCQAE
jgi:hypothetical protein